ncbi:hypothetical protein EDC01DRAFT_616322, partial [Geopyxis carbonaria]
MGFHDVASYKAGLQELAVLTGIQAIKFDVCKNNCVCYAGYSDHTSCPVCALPRCDPQSSKPWRSFSYIPLLHRLALRYADLSYVQRIHKYKSTF